MATINRESIETFISITGAPESIATRRLEDCHGNLNEAINAHFSEGDRNIVQDTSSISTAPPPNDFMNIDNPPQMEPRGPSLVSATRGLNSFSLLDPTFRSLFDGSSIVDSNAELMGRAPYASQPREVREIPVDLKDGHDNSTGGSSQVPRIEDVTDIEHAEGSEFHGTAILDETISRNQQGNRNSGIDSRLSAPSFDDRPDHGNDIEEEMIRAAIEASKRDAELQNKQDGYEEDDTILSNQQGNRNSEVDSRLSAPQFDDRPDYRNDVEEEMIRAAIEASKRDTELQSEQTSEQERLQHQQGLKAGASGLSGDKNVEMEELGKIEDSNLRQNICSLDKPSSSQQKDKAGTREKIEEMVEQPLVRNRSRHRSSGFEEAHTEVGEAEVSPALNPPEPSVSSETRLNGNVFPSDEWGGISSEEHDEAVMLEAAMFGGIPESGYRLPYASRPMTHSGLDVTWRAPRPPSPGLVARRAIREQQDDEYFAALQADRGKELRAIEEEKAARKAALEEERQREEELRRKLEEEQELERQIAAKEASLPQEPPSNDENAVTLVVRMPDGSRHGRRFLKFDKLQSLFDFIDIGRGVKPGTYRLVRPYPRRAFSDGESSSSLNNLGLTNKQEALFLELI